MDCHKFISLVLGPALLTAAVAGCVYPYDNPVPESQYSGIVVEGDLLIGGVSEISLSRLLPLTEDATEQEDMASVKGAVCAETWSGDRFDALRSPDGSYRIDLSHAPVDKEYRLKVTTTDGAVYTTPYMAPSGTCQIDGLGFKVDNGDVNILINMHSDGSSRHFRYSYYETWEYHSDVQARLLYEPSSQLYPYGRVLNLGGASPYYYCWKKTFSRGINLFTTETMDVDRLEDYPIRVLRSNDIRFRIAYRMDLNVYPVDSNSYRYYEHLKEVSTYTGSLFAPVPSELKGNVSCSSDPTRAAYGYVAVVRPASARIELGPDDVGYIHNSPVETKYVSGSDEKGWPRLYGMGYLPVESDPIKGMQWAQARCVDCRLMGGNKEKPADWPTYHQ